jgi:hypothetical protein
MWLDAQSILVGVASDSCSRVAARAARPQAEVMAETTKTKTNETDREVHILAGHFIKLIDNGVTLARAYAQNDGTWRCIVRGGGWDGILLPGVEAATSWIALQAVAL